MAASPDSGLADGLLLYCPDGGPCEPSLKVEYKFNYEDLATFLHGGSAVPHQKYPKEYTPALVYTNVLKINSRKLLDIALYTSFLARCHGSFVILSIHTVHSGRDKRFAKYIDI